MFEDTFILLKRYLSLSNFFFIKRGIIKSVCDDLNRIFLPGLEHELTPNDKLIILYSKHEDPTKLSIKMN